MVISSSLFRTAFRKSCRIISPSVTSAHKPRSGFILTQLFVKLEALGPGFHSILTKRYTQTWASNQSDCQEIVIRDNKREPPVYTRDGGKVVRRRSPYILGAVEEPLPIEDYYYQDGYLCPNLWRPVNVNELETCMRARIVCRGRISPNYVRIEADASVRYVHRFLQKMSVQGVIIRVWDKDNIVNCLLAKYRMAALLNSNSVLLQELTALSLGLEQSGQGRFHESYAGVNVCSDSLHSLFLIQKIGVYVLSIEDPFQDTSVSAILNEDLYHLICHILIAENVDDIVKILEVVVYIVNALRTSWSFKKSEFARNIYHQFRETMFLVDYATRQTDGEPGVVYDVNQNASTFQYFYRRDQNGQYIRFPKTMMENWKASA